MISGIITHSIAAVVGAIGFALILKNNSKLQKLFNLISDKIEEKIEEETGKDL